MCSSSITICSSLSSRKAVISYEGNEHLKVQIEGFDINITKEIWLYTDADALNQFFQKLGSKDSKWDGCIEWKSVEGDFSISVTCSALGKIAFRVAIEGLQGNSEAWNAQINIEADFGILKEVARQSKSCFMKA
ncbi:MAG: DUF6228 family protein [Proteobacteria bacterium]|nr:DUF6228 family protein [Pseudomonadota bacterium]MCL2307687.1 DUF6228 family protein [Pseudomonadota bacterium]